MYELRALGVRPDFVTDEAWNRYREYRASADFKARSEKASHNRKSEKGDPSTGPSKHTGGTRSFQTYKDIFALDKDEDDEVTPNDVFLHVHMKDHDGSLPSALRPPSLRALLKPHRCSSVSPLPSALLLFGVAHPLCSAGLQLRPSPLLSCSSASFLPSARLLFGFAPPYCYSLPFTSLSSTARSLPFSSLASTSPTTHLRLQLP
ncbi:hypothetical protein Syun_006766 [Stephania yunnanensis]|uniref:Uncharacterized protein n=1 Tax=Stephania yunnanensis TaxID=152371 RepID=A0AAP0KZU1_9MAGN